MTTNSDEDAGDCFGDRELFLVWTGRCLKIAFTKMKDKKQIIDQHSRVGAHGFRKEKKQILHKS